MSLSTSTTRCDRSPISTPVRLGAAVLALPLALALVGASATAASAGGRPDTAGSAGAPAVLLAGADRGADTSDDRANDRANEAAGAPAAAQANGAAPAQPAEKKAAPAAAAPARAEAPARPAEKKAAPAAAPAKTETPAQPAEKKAAPAAAPAKRDSSSRTDKHGTAGSGPLTAPQPISKADSNGTGANPGNDCTHAYCSTRDGSASKNGNGGGQAAGKPCAGCVGKADNKNPKGQATDGRDANQGYECDGNNGIGKTNPAHTGCAATTSEPPVTVELCPDGSALPVGGNKDCPIPPTCPDGSPRAAGASCDKPVDGPVLPQLCPDGSALPASGPAGCDRPVFGPPTGLPGSDGQPLDGQPLDGGSEAPATGSDTDTPDTGVLSGGVVGRGATAPTLLPGAVLGASVQPAALPFTGTDGVLLVTLGGLLLVGGTVLTVAARRERTARS